MIVLINAKKSVSFLLILLSSIVFVFPVMAIDLGEAGLEDARLAAEIGNAKLDVVIGNVIKIVLSLMGMIAAIFLIVGGFMWMTSAGNEEKIKKARAIMGAAIIGIVVVLIAYAAATFIINQLSTITTGNTSMVNGSGLLSIN